ncbi:MAG: pyruvate kinase [Bacteroidia bacterium]|nr:pyruvate kinase [Bacteroidia bacterium]
MKLFHLRKTKIVATLGPACSDTETLLQMVEAGMDVARLNFSHADHATHAKWLGLIRGINEKYGTNIAILQDLQGPKIRLGDLTEPLKVKTGDIITLQCDTAEHVGNVLPIHYETFARDVKAGEPVLFDDGKVEAVVVETNGTNKVKLKIIVGDELKSRKGVNLPQTKISVPTITEKDFRDIDFAIENKIDWLALSFVRTADDIRLLKEIIRLKNGISKIIAKIEKPQALENIEAIIQVSDGIMVARGDLGVEIPMEEVPAWQKRIIKLSNKYGKPVILATQVMESMIENARPTRAEANDVANALVDGADAVMLSGETSVGKWPVRVVSSMDRILRSVEREDEGVYYKNFNSVPGFDEPMSTAIISTACKLAEDTNAKAILAMTHSGYTAMQLAKCRPKAQVYAFTSDRQVLQMLNLVWGIRGFLYNRDVSTDETIQDVHEILKERDLVEPGDIIINTGSMPLHEQGLTNMVKISRVREKGLVREIE